VQGRLKVCTRGFFFEPQDFTLPIMRFFFRDMAQMPIAELYDQASGADCALFLSFESTQVTELKVRGVDHPYVTKETTPIEDEPEDAAGATNNNSVPSKYVFALLHSKIEEFLRSVVPIWELAHQKNVLNKVDEEILLEPVLRPRLTSQFDSSLLVDFRERPLLTAGKLVDRIVPLLKYPGCLMLTNQRYTLCSVLANILMRWCQHFA
jgi:factor associated with neutral sphingomyelinase activation